MISEKGATALAIMGTVCWCVQLIPQIIFNYRRKNCEGFPPSMMFLWVVSGIPFAIYFMVTKGNVILQIQPHLFMVFSAISYAQCLYYPPVQWKWTRIVQALVILAVVDIGMEVGFTLWLRPVYSRGTHWPSLIFGIIASVLLGLGLLPPYFELAKRQGRVIGINFLFLFVDSLGAWLSIVSVILGNMDVMGIALYSVIAGLEIGIFLSHFIWCCRFKWFWKGDPADEESQLRDEGNGKSVELKIDGSSNDYQTERKPDETETIVTTTAASERTIK
ncbi:LAQU0S04e09428g1_1 [Lachancea quebecensis]|uniref:LAQU0S04e09428g1_1 n=1 Tax=Lachancea quebecensis TaxID=1654605 RepID=A0A0P1KR78_9SACH|nr:LAQU0S04e09428g1_1 [Lachancea quebecensis]